MRSPAWSLADVPRLHGKVAMVTGANSGLGLVIADELARAGATVILACRSEGKARDAMARIASPGSVTQGPLEFLSLDLADLSSVSAAAASFVATGRPLHLLINNAGLMAVDQSKTVDGFEMQFGVNHLGHFALTADLMPTLLATAGSRVVSMSSMGHRAGRMHFDDIMFAKRYDRWRPYFQSKLANLLFTAELHRRLQQGGQATAALAAHPGGSRTDLGSEGKGFTNAAMRRVVPLMTQSAEVGAQPALRAAVDPHAVSGEFYGPRWMGVGYAVRETPSKAARNAEDAGRLWTLSEELTGRTVLAP
jgi:protochlorophyllide reductase